MEHSLMFTLSRILIFAWMIVVSTNLFVALTLSQQLCLNVYSFVNLYLGYIYFLLRLKCYGFHVSIRQVCNRYDRFLKSWTSMFNVMNKNVSLNKLVHGMVNLLHYIILFLNCNAIFTWAHNWRWLGNKFWWRKKI